MDPTHAWPVYYLPPGCPRPDHCVHLGGSHIDRHLGPADATPDERGGSIWGGPWDDRLLPLLRKTQAGWWVAMGAATPAHLARLEPLDGPTITHGSRSWLVPRLLAIRPSFGLVSALPREFRDYQWRDPERFADLQDRLRALLTWRGPEDPDAVPDQTTTDLAAEVLAVNYHLSIHELTIAGWLDERLVAAILLATVGQGADPCPTP